MTFVQVMKVLKDDVDGLPEWSFNRSGLWKSIVLIAFQILIPLILTIVGSIL